jgi:outer membrane protein TolC
VRQQQIRVQQLEKQIRLEITNALIAVEQARESYEAVQSERVLQEQTVAAEKEKLDVGATTSFYVIQYQRDLAAARSAEVSALASYEKAKTALQRAVGTILEDYSVQFDEALQGVVSSTGRVRP